MRTFWNRLVRVSVETVRVFLKSNCSMHAAGLTYFSILAVVPFLCCILVIAKGLGVGRFARMQIDAHVGTMIGSLASEPSVVMKVRHIFDTLFAQIETFDMSTLGWIGLACLLWTVVSSLGRVEVSFNCIWQIERPRALWKRVLLYLLITIALPIFISLAMSMPVLKIVKDVLVRYMGSLWLTKWVSDGVIALIESCFFRYAVTLSMATATFAFFYWVLPNCRVRFRDALFGGLMTAVAFAAWLKICAVAQIGIAHANALYGSFSFIPIVLAGLYVSWQIILFGAAFVRVCENASLR